MDAYETSIYFTVLITGILLGTIIILFAWSTIRSQRRYFERIKKEYQTELELLEERNRIARDLHDELGPSLWALKMRMRKLQQGGDPESELPIMEQMVEQIAQGMRSIAINLMPATLVSNGINGALKDLVDKCAACSDLQISMEPGAIRKLPLDMNLHVLRIVQELIQNTQKHANARHVLIQLFEEDDKLILIYEDDGAGMNTEQEESSGMGLNNIRDRTMIIGGTMQCFTEKGAGTRYCFEIPVSKWKK